VLTENVAILTYLAKRFPEAQLLPDGMIEQARCLSMMAWFASAVHTTFAHIIRPERFASDSAAHGNLKETARGVFWDNCKEINGQQWMMGTQYTVCDPYALFFYDLGTRIKLPMHELTAYAAFFHADAGTRGGVQGARVGARYGEGRECLAWTILRPARHS
jgi:glutathione S-transferase